MKTKSILFIATIFACFFYHNSSSYAEPLTQSDVASLSKIETMQHIQYQSYLQMAGGPAGVIGYYFDRYFTQNAFSCLGIFGAVSGNRGGYGIAAIGLGYRVPISSSITIEFRSLIGSGGGGGVPAGGGLAILTGAGALVQIQPNALIDVGYSWLQFPSGTLNTPAVHIGLALKSDLISL